MKRQCKNNWYKIIRTDYILHLFIIENILKTYESWVLRYWQSQYGQSASLDLRKCKFPRSLWNLRSMTNMDAFLLCNQIRSGRIRSGRGKLQNIRTGYVMVKEDYEMYFVLAAKIWRNRLWVVLWKVKGIAKRHSSKEQSPLLNWKDNRSVQREVKSIMQLKGPDR